MARTKISVLEQKSKQIRVLDATTQALLADIAIKDRKQRFWASVAFALLMVVGVVGLYYQNYLSVQNKAHIDCIIKDLATPRPPDTQQKYIELLGNECHIKFT